MTAWLTSQNGSIPPSAMAIGREADGDDLFVARAAIPGGGTQIGKIRSGFGGAYLPFGGAEVRAEVYEVLTGSPEYFPEIPGSPPPPPTYSYPAGPEKDGFVPPWYPNDNNGVGSQSLIEFHAVKAGEEEDGTPLFAALAAYEGGFHPGKVRLGLYGGANVSYGGSEITALNPYSVWCDGSYGWAMKFNTPVPADCVVCGQDDDGTDLYLARAIGPDFGTGRPLGKIRPDGWGESRGASFPYGGNEYYWTNYEVFCTPTNPGPSATAEWISASNGKIPDGAVAMGCEGDGTPLFAARAKYGSGQHPGKIRHGFNGAHIGYGGNEVVVSTYDVLVRPSSS